MPLTLVTGPVRSGKSRFVENLARRHGGAVLYVATARFEPSDAEWADRIALHRATRPAAWEVLESAAPGASPLGDVVRAAPAGRAIVIDSLGTWLAAQMHEGVTAADLQHRADAFASDVLASAASVYLVGEEVGWGIVPLAPSARMFRDVMGRTQQRLAREATAAYLVVNGYAIDLKTTGTSVDLDR